MRHSARLLGLLLALSGVGCAATLAPRYTANLRGLAPPEPPVEVQGGVTVMAQAVTQSTWREHPSLWMSLQWETADTSSTITTRQIAHDPMSGAVAVSSTDLATLRHQETADVAVVPVPGFLVQIVNQSGHDLALGRARIALTDELGHRFPWISDRAAVLRRAEDDLLARYPLLGDRAQRATELEDFRRAQADVSLLSAETTIGDGVAYQGYAVFDLGVAGLDELRAFMAHAGRITMELEIEGAGAPFRFSFAVQRRPPGVVCADGTRRAAVIDCPEQEWGTQPAADGPCIQQTHKKSVLVASQWWIGGVPVANNDLFRTVLADPIARPQMKRGLVLRGLGYSLIGAGLLLTAGAAPLVIHAYGLGAGPDAIGFGGLSLVGVIVTAIGNRAHDRAINLYNQQADVTGFCAPVR